MKKIFNLLLCLCLLIPMIGLSEPSITVKDTIYSEPEISFELYEEQEAFNLDIEGYEAIEALVITLDKPYEKVTWYLGIEIQPTDTFKIALYNCNLFIRDCETLEDGGISVDFTDIVEGEYLMLIFRKENI